MFRIAVCNVLKTELNVYCRKNFTKQFAAKSWSWNSTHQRGKFKAAQERGGKKHLMDDLPDKALVSRMRKIAFAGTSDLVQLIRMVELCNERSLKLPMEVVTKLSETLTEEGHLRIAATCFNLCATSSLISKPEIRNVLMKIVRNKNGGIVNYDTALSTILSLQQQDVDVSTNVIIDIFSLYQKTLLSDHWSEVEGSETPLSTVSEKRRTDLLGSIDQKFITVLSNAANASSACSSLNFGSGIVDFTSVSLESIPALLRIFFSVWKEKIVARFLHQYHMRHSSVLYAPEQYDAAHICIAHDDHVASLNPNPQSFEYWMKDCAYLDQFLEDAVQDLIIILDSSRRTASLNTYNVVESDLKEEYNIECVEYFESKLKNDATQKIKKPLDSYCNSVSAYLGAAEYQELIMKYLYGHSDVRRFPLIACVSIDQIRVWLRSELLNSATEANCSKRQGRKSDGGSVHFHGISRCLYMNPSSVVDAVNDNVVTRIVVNFPVNNTEARGHDMIDMADVSALETKYGINCSGGLRLHRSIGERLKADEDGQEDMFHLDQKKSKKHLYGDPVRNKKVILDIIAYCKENSPI